MLDIVSAFPLGNSFVPNFCRDFFSQFWPFPLPSAFASNYRTTLLGFDLLDEALQQYARRLAVSIQRLDRAANTKCLMIRTLVWSPARLLGAEVSAESTRSVSGRQCG